MLPLHVAKEIRTSILEYLKATFTFREQRMNKAFIQFLESSNEGIFKGPYISLQLPFEKTSDSSNENTPLDIHPSFPAYLHQQKAFERLSTHNEHPPQPTIVTTGTGSGKTEAFLFPLLDYCYQQRERRGIKAIIMYPMNALATDQAKRIAEEIHKHPKLKGVVTAGLFIGEGKGKMARSREMTQKNIIEDREFILSNPPDILLTNFKMLDYALIKASYHSIWRHNLHDLQLFKFLVLDELHTYDGAQGSDVANLIRRFKLKIHLADGQLCPVGTSATIGSAEEAPQLLAEYATKIFGEIVEPSAIIGEKRLPIDVFFKSEREQLKDFLPKENALFAASLKRTDDYSIYLTKQLQLWNIEVGVSPLKVSEKLLEYGIFYDLLETCNSNILAVSELIRALSRKNPNYAAYSNDSKEALLESLLCLIGFAKSGEENKAFPFLYLQVQMWLREVRGMLRTVQHSPHFVWNRDKEKTDQPALPMYFCRECGGSGWIGVKEENKEYFERDYAKTYDAYFSNHKNLYFFNTVENELADDYDPTNKIMGHLSNTTLGLYEKKSDNTFPINAVRKLFNSYNAHICPHCNTRNTMALIGTRITTLASVALSQIMSTDMDAQTEKGRKLLAFTNGVQDAAHRAGFFEARNYNFTLRTAIQKVLNLEQSPMNIPQLYKAFVNYWSKQTDESNKNPIEAYYYKFFPKDHIGKITIDNFKDGKEKFQKRFEDEFNRRILWQITSEFGYNARIGRTLEKTGTSATFFKKETLQQVFQKIKAWLRANGIQNIEEKEFVSFLTGFLHRLRMRGGMSHPYSEKFRTEKSNYYLLTQGVNKSYFLMQNFGKKSRLPKYITYKSNPYNVFDLTERNKNLNWYHAYFNKSFPLVMAGNELQLINEFYATLLDYLESEQVLNKRLAIGIPNYALNPKVVCVSTKVEQYDCRVCGHQMTTTQEAEGTMEGMTCLQYRCTGKYQLLDGETATYYQSVYNRDRVIRLYAKDHTGLLERKKRELLEEDFKNRNKHNSTNVMVATSTLEMGIDIGDLNAAVNTSIPPLPSNFLQRIGRAGRKSGTAFILNFASTNAHDLYYYLEPREMMQGKINTPGCFLEAKDILKRHFTAYCFDQWASTNPQQNIFPTHIKFWGILRFDLNSPQFFINQIIEHVQENEDAILQSFKGKYEVPKVDTHSFDHLANEIKTKRFYADLNQVLRDLKAELEYYHTRRETISKQVEKLQKTDPERIELKRDYKNVGGAIRLFHGRNTLEHLTNIGLLPNYAFPETGVQLNAQITNKKAEGEYDNTSIEIVRSAKTAIKELVPENAFYTQGYKLNISGVQVVNWKDEATTYRFCSKCDHLEKDIHTAKNCPKCSDPSWGAATNKHSLLKLKTVISYSKSDEAALDDVSDEREQYRTNISRHFGFSHSEGAYVLGKIPFGFEYVKQVKIIEINTNQTEIFNKSRQIEINEQAVSGVGYVICASCGKSSKGLLTNNRTNQAEEARAYHYGYCKHKNTAYKGKADAVFKEVYLYREISTEAIKILLPVQEFDSESQVKMFMAGINLGLRHYFRGNPQHLDLVEYADFNQDTGKKDRYLVMYDLIPGGTGYLAQLFNQESDGREFGKLIRQAYLAIKECNCQHEGKDGCYRCIYTYSNQYDRAALSRKEAEKIFERLQANSDKWLYQEDGFGKTTGSGRIEESELESRFIRLLEKYCKNTHEQERAWSFRPVVKNEVVHYEIGLTHHGLDYLYEVIPQFKLDNSKGVAYYTIADFLIQCIGVKKDGIGDYEAMQAVRPIAIYLDGYRYHASSQHPIFPKDVLKRQAILESGKYLSWTLTWDDLKRFEENLSDDFEKRKNRNLESQIRARHPVFPKKDSGILKAENNLKRLLALLSFPDYDETEKNVKMFFCLQSNDLNKSDYIIPSKIESFLSNFSKEIKSYKASFSKNHYRFLSKLPFNGELQFKIVQDLKALDTQGNLRFSKNVITREWSKKNWEAFWHAFNLIQFLPKVKFQIIEGEDSIQKDTKVIEESPASKEKNEESVLENFEEQYHSLILYLLQKGIDFNRNEDYVLETEDGEIIAEAILGLPSYKIVFEPFDEDYTKLFLNKGYTLAHIDSFDTQTLLR